MSFISELERLIKYASKDHMQQNKLANYLHSHADEIAELVKAVSQEHGGNHHEPECPICITLANLNKE